MSQPKRNSQVRNSRQPDIDAETRQGYPKYTNVIDSLLKHNYNERMSAPDAVAEMKGMINGLP